MEAIRSRNPRIWEISAIDNAEYASLAVVAQVKSICTTHVYSTDRP